MSTLYRPQIVEYRLPDGACRTPDGRRVTKQTPGAVRRVSRSPTWHGRFTDRTGRRHQVKLDKSKSRSSSMLDKLAGDAQLAGVGLDDPFDGHRTRPLLEHLKDFGRYLAAKGNCAEHVTKTSSQARAIIAGCGFKKIGDLQSSAVIEFLADMRATGEQSALPLRGKSLTVKEVAGLLGIRTASVWRMVRRGQLACEGQGRKRRFASEAVTEAIRRRRGVGINTTNHYLVSIKQFSKWLVKDRRAAFDALAGMSRQNDGTDVRHPRRALTEEAFARFVEATAAGKTFRGLTGADRLVVYTLGANTGFRASELASLTPASFELDAGQRTVTVEAGYSKHRRPDVQPLRSDVAEMMRLYVAGRPRKKQLWPGSWPDAGAEMVRLDLAAAGIPYQDEAGRYFDFHAIRGQFVSSLAAAGVHPKVAQVLARHSTITLTMKNYTHLDVLDVAGALDKLPALPGDKSASQPEQHSRRA
jgi:excisionase family DNA binding protein